jgi:hypothetical protein
MADLSRSIGMRLYMRNVAPGSGKGRVVSEISLPQLTPLQIARLESLLRAGFKFVTFESYARYLAVEKKGFVALLEVSGEKVRKFGSVGYHLGGGIGVLVERESGKAFVWKSESVVATPELLADYARVKKELDDVLEEGATQ